MKRTALFLVAIIAFSAAVFGQNEAPKQVSGGVLNGKARSLPKPAYPAAARAVNAEGAVSVQVLIDEEGNVISANAVSGHPLLRAAAAEAARGAVFSPTQLMGNPVKVSGVITYNFVGAMTPGIFGYEIAFAERKGMFAESSFAESLASRLPDDWTAEKEMLTSLTYEKPAESGFSLTDQATKDIVVRDPNRFTVRGSVNAYARKKLTPESIESLRRLQLSAETRLSTETARWHFGLGKALGVFVAEIEDDNRFRENLAELEQLRANRPSGVPAAAAARLKEFIAQAKATELGPEGRKTRVFAAQNLRTLRISQW